jgi:hypothetical protein
VSLSSPVVLAYLAVSAAPAVVALPVIPKLIMICFLSDRPSINVSNATSSGYASSAGSASEVPVNISAPEPGAAKMLIFPNSKLKIAYGTIGVPRQHCATQYFPVAFSNAVRAVHGIPSALTGTYITSARCSDDTSCSWPYMVMGY